LGEKKDEKDLLFLFRDFGYVKLIGNLKGDSWLVYVLTPEQKKYYGKGISPFLCWKREKLCGQKLRRPHLTCLSCKTRLVVEGRLPMILPIIIKQVWYRKNRSQFYEILSKIFLSLAEVVT